jgi:AcrR family transcriptional regulator
MPDQPRDLLGHVRAACTELTRTGVDVTFTAIAERTGISRATLYRRRELRELIDRHRTPTGLATQVEQLRHSLEAVAAKVRRHEEELRRLRPATPRPQRRR